MSIPLAVSMYFILSIIFIYTSKNSIKKAWYFLISRSLKVFGVTRQKQNKLKVHARLCVKFALLLLSFKSPNFSTRRKKQNRFMYVCAEWVLFAQSAFFFFSKRSPEFNRELLYFLSILQLSLLATTLQIGTLIPLTDAETSSAWLFCGGQSSIYNLKS